MDKKKKPFLSIGQALDIVQGIAIFLAVILLILGGYLLYQGVNN